MVKIVSLLLIPFFVLGQALTHSHAGTGIADPDGHASHPHVHLHGHEHSDHHHNPSAEDAKPSQGDELSCAVDHDADAIYFNESAKLTRACTSIAIAIRLDDFVVYSVPVVVEGQCRYHAGDPPDLHAKLPIYLLIASLRL